MLLPSQLLFGTRRRGFAHDFPSHLDHFVAVTDRFYGTAPELIETRTLLPFFRPLRDAATRSDAEAHMRLGNAKVDTTAAKGFKTAQTTDAAVTCIDINTASASQLDRLDHVGPATAKRIVAHRPYRSLDSLTKISGLSNGYVADIRRGGLTCSIN